MTKKHFHLSDEALLRETARAANREKSATLDLIDYLLEVDRRKTYAICDRPYSSLHAYVAGELGYSGGQASERVAAVRLIQSVPQAYGNLEEGKLTLTSAAQIHRFFKAEKQVGESLSLEEKSEVVAKCIGESSREVDKILFQEASVPAKSVMQEKVRRVAPERTELKFSVDDLVRAKIQRARELLGDRSLEQIFEVALDTLVAMEEKKRKMNPNTHAQPKRSGKEVARVAPTAARAPSNSRYIPADFKRSISARSQNQCEYVHSSTKLRCQSRFRLETDHVQPLALGGTTTLENLRHLCATHNARAAIEAGLARESFVMKRKSRVGS